MSTGYPSQTNQNVENLLHLRQAQTSDSAVRKPSGNEHTRPKPGVIPTMDQSSATQTEKSSLQIARLRLDP